MDADPAVASYETNKTWDTQFPRGDYIPAVAVAAVVAIVIVVVAVG